MDFIPILTYDCNFRCRYCDVAKRKESLTAEVVERLLLWIETANIPIDRVKFFGGEPLMERVCIESIVRRFPRIMHPQYLLTTNGTYLDDTFMAFARAYKIRITISIDGDMSDGNRRRIDGKNPIDEILGIVRCYADEVCINQVIPANDAHRFFENFLFLYGLGVRRYNFLPEYYRPWSRASLRSLSEGFRQILDFRRAGNTFEVINIENLSDVPFFNLGIIVDTDGSIYATNLILLERFSAYRERLRIGHVSDTGLPHGWADGYIDRVRSLIREAYPPHILTSVDYIDRILHEFCLCIPSTSK